MFAMRFRISSSTKDNPWPNWSHRLFTESTPKRTKAELQQACTQPERDQTKPKPNHAAIRNFLSTCDHRTSDHKSNDANNQVCGPMSKGVHLSLCLRCCTSATQPWKLRLAKRNKLFLGIVEHLVVWGETCQPCMSIAHSVGP